MLRNVKELADVFGGYALLNEVLSLNAQEFTTDKFLIDIPVILNEVLSLNAQELLARVLTMIEFTPSSMKS